MSNPARAPRLTVPNATGVRFVKDCHFAEVYAEGGAFVEVKRLAKNLDANTKLLEGRDMEIRNPIIINREYTLDPRASRESPYFANAKKGTASFRVRSGAARDAVQAFYAKASPELQDLIDEKSEATAMVDAGAEYSMGRLRNFYPAKGSKISHPITAAEARFETAREVGYALARGRLPEGTDLERLPFIAEVEGTPSVRINRASGNGFPVMGKGGDPEAAALYIPLANRVREELEVAYKADPVKGVYDWVRTAEREAPWLVGVMGKAKADFYTYKKVAALQMRFYNTLGRQIMINMQTGTQRIEELSESVLDHPADNRSASGASLAHGGAARFIYSLDEQVYRGDKGSIRMGDDSFVAYQYQVGDVLYIILLALDASSFDLTQHRSMTLEVHKELLRVNSQVDPVSAQLLYAFQRERLVVMHHRSTYQVLHGGPSGLPEQSKVNGIIMGVLIERLFDALDEFQDTGGELSEQTIDPILQRVGHGMGIRVRLEQYRKTLVPRGEIQPVAYSLAQDGPFLFLGMMFYKEDGEISVYAEPARALSQMRYPKNKWIEGKKELAAKEAARLASTMLSMGKPPRDMLASYDAMREVCLAQLDKVLTYGDVSMEDFGMVIEDVAVLSSGETFKSIAGLRAALARPWDYLWGMGSVAMTNDELVSKVEESIPRVELGVPVAIKRSVPPTRKPSAKTAGRNPTTKVWGPAQAPKLKYRPHEGVLTKGAGEVRNVDEDDAEAIAAAWQLLHMNDGANRDAGDDQSVYSGSNFGEEVDYDDAMETQRLGGRIVKR